MTETKQNLKQLRVDNWATFFLQRLQLLFAKGDCCDLVLRFHTGQELKVHRLVLNTCTNFFDTLEREDNVVHLPENLPYGVVQPIINFLYSGRLEFKYDLHNQLLNIAKQLNITILAKLLIAQKNDHGTAASTAGKLPDRKPRTFLATRINTPPVPTGPYANNMIGGRKLPIWRPRTMPMYRNYERKPIKEEEPKPTRFEWPEDGVDAVNNMLITSPSFAPLSYDSAPVVPLCNAITPHSSASTTMKNPLESSANATPQKSVTGVKRRIIGSEPPAKKAFYLEKPVNSTNSEAVDPNLVGSDDEYDDDGHFESIHDFGDSDDEIPPPPVTKESTKVIPKVQGTPKPILKPVTESVTSSTAKKVRFSFAPENKENEASPPAEKPKEEDSPKQEVESPKSKMSVNNEKTAPAPANHAKIIAEVLKKYPDLVKNNKNIKLKISSPTTGTTNTLTLDTKKSDGHCKTSYVVVRPSNAKPDLMTKSTVTAVSPTNPSMVPAQAVTSWECRTCVQESEPLKFDTYYDHRKHMEEVHHEKFDSRICEYCAYKTSKRNVLLYHLYTKHNVEPPKSTKFPKCTQCSYIALSEGLLQKHLASHQTIKDLTCNVCRSVFRSSQILQAHAVCCKPNNEQRSYVCKLCKKTFRSNVSLNAHAKSCTGVVERGSHNIFDDDIVDIAQVNAGMDMIEVPVVDEDKNGQQTTYVQLPSGIILAEPQNVTLMPSAESEGLTNVATGIATSIGLTVTLPQDQAVILLDANQQFLFQDSGETVMVSTSNSTEEYIVPEILDENVQQIYSTDGLQYVSSSDVITCPVEAIPGEVPNGLDEDQRENFEECLSGDVIEVPLSEEEREKIAGLTSDADKDISIHAGVSHQSTSSSSDHHILCIVEPDPGKNVGATDEQPSTEEFIFDDSNVTIEETPDTNETAPSVDDVSTLPPPSTSDDESTRELPPPPASPDHSSSNQTEPLPETSEEVPMEVEEESAYTSTEQSENVSTIAEQSHDSNAKTEDVEGEEEDKANSLVKDWGFDNEEETAVDESNDADPNSGPCRVTVDL